ncbi:hypothetical protein PYW07_009366 [Mythimna separata]|uniref:C2H2-type domain-containing protein n=1 Tax=Mythimna separata TaxID=271217 RepID=A0AAD8DN84_MYTSE|nr:hypothetical protein PYW07_009366 [Mythimna separata]
MYHLHLYQLKFYYEEVMALQFNEQDGLPQYFCYECATILHKFHRFKEKCYSGQKSLRDLAWRGPITYERIYRVDRNKFLTISPLRIDSYNDQNKTYNTKDSIDTDKQFDAEKKIEKIENIELDYFSNASIPDHEDSMLDYVKDSMIDGLGVHFDDEKIKIDKKTNTEPFSDSTVYVGNEKGVMKTECGEVSEKNNGARGTSKVLDKLYWKRYTLSEEEAVMNFRARAEDKKYKNAAYKCTDCLKGFSKKDMLARHIELRHVESLGPFECHFCRMRYKLNCYLTKHIRQHYFKYECLRCHLICPLESSALLHDEYHSGITKKCAYCDEEFRHTSTYYTHLRTHRSEHVCVICGASFVSKAGLHQHKIVKHVIDDVESPDDDEEVNTYCERCEINFETRKAYEEHLFHSALHSEGDSEYKQTVSRKVLGKRQQAKVTRRLRKRNHEEDILKFTKDKKGKTKYRREHKKPTTCHQCGKHFDTQAACWQHHLSEHPRTSFYSPTERYICEICGSSLAPGSIRTHQNMHTREKLHTCDTCGRQFHANVGLKRHLLTHTGEKPYSCSLCDKSFTQSNSMKLHFRTFHLKEPYPKRNRRKTKEEPMTADADESNSESESDSSVPDIEPGLPDSGTAVKPVSDVGHVTDKPSDENMHYLTLT